MNKTPFKTKFDSPHVSPGFLLWQITNKWQARQRKALKAFGLTHVQFVLLATLTWVSEKSVTTQKQLATQAKSDVMMTSQIVRTLIKKGLVTRSKSRTDGRAFILHPTHEGRLLVNRAIVAVERVDNEFFSVIGGDDLQNFIKAMQQLAD